MKPKFRQNQLDTRGSSTVTHEYGHMLGYHVSKNNKDDFARFKNDTDSHAWRSDPEESNYIMARISRADHSQRRVHALEYTRLGGSRERRSKVSYNEGVQTGFGGLYTPRHITNKVR